MWSRVPAVEIPRADQREAEQEELGNELDAGSEKKGRFKNDSNPRRIPIFHTTNWIVLQRKRSEKKRLGCDMIIEYYVSNYVCELTIRQASFDI